MSTFPLLHEANWTPTVDRHTLGYIGRQQAEWLRNYSASEAKSSDFSLREGNGREILGKVLQDGTIPEHWQAICDLLQARSFCFQTAVICLATMEGHGIQGVSSAMPLWIHSLTA
eukprot:3941436-Rhodomonas_salina.2